MRIRIRNSGFGILSFCLGLYLLLTFPLGGWWGVVKSSLYAHKFFRPNLTNWRLAVRQFCEPLFTTSLPWNPERVVWFPFACLIPRMRELWELPRGVTRPFYIYIAAECIAVLRIRILLSEVWIRILPSLGKNSKKNLYTYILGFLYDFYLLRMM